MRAFILLTVFGLVLSQVGCAVPSMAPSRPKAAAEEPADHDWYNTELARKGWTEGKSDWETEKKPLPSTGYTADQKHMMLLKKPKVETWRHQQDMISDMIWGRTGGKK